MLQVLSENSFWFFYSLHTKTSNEQIIFHTKLTNKCNVINTCTIVHEQRIVPFYRRIVPFKFFLYNNIDDLTKTGLKKLLSIVK